MYTIVFFRCSRCFDCYQPSFDICTKCVHVLSVLREPVHNITVVAGNAQLVALAVADDILFRQSVLLAEIYAKFYRFLVDLKLIGTENIVYIGSANYSNESANNIESGVLIEDKEFIQRLYLEFFDVVA